MCPTTLCVFTRRGPCRRHQTYKTKRFCPVPNENMEKITFLRDATGNDCPARLLRNEMLLTLFPDTPNAIDLDIRQILHETASVDMVKKYCVRAGITRSGNKYVNLSTSREGSFAGVAETTDGGYMYTHRGTAVRKETVTAAAVARSQDKLATRLKRKAEELRPPSVANPQDDEAAHFDPPPPAIYSPRSPQHSPGTSGNAVNERDDDHVEFVQEKTREQRDEEGRANAITLE